MRRLICLGDSITDSGRLFSPDGLGHGYVRQLHQKLNHTSDTFKIINRGIDGFTVNRLLENVGRDCIDRRPDFVTILIGVNDVCLMMNTNRTSSQQEKMLADFGRSYRQLLHTIMQHTNSTCILMEPFIFPYPQEEYKNWVPFIKEISGQIRKLASEYHCPYILLHDTLNQAAGIEGYRTITSDGVHLAPRGHEIIADRLFSYIRSI